MAKPNSVQTATSQSAQVNNAAKDDCLPNGISGQYSVKDLLANDPGSAMFVGFSGDGVTLNADHTFTINAGISQFDYTVRIANGTYSTATVHVAQPTGPELVKNWSFEDGQTTIGGAYATFDNLPNWTTNAGSAKLEVVSAGYNDILGDGHWLDTQGSPGPIDISQVLAMTPGEHAQMSFCVAAEKIVSAGLMTSPDEKLDFMFGGQIVKELTLHDFPDANGVNYNHFQTFTTNVTGGADDTLRIVSHGASANVGFAIDSVSVKALTCAATSDHMA
jgi:hypothetical protein